MALIGLSIIVASLLYIAIRPQKWLLEILSRIRAWPHQLPGAPPPSPNDAGIVQEEKNATTEDNGPAPSIGPDAAPKLETAKSRKLSDAASRMTSENKNKAARDRVSMPPPPPPHPPRINMQLPPADAEPVATNGVAVAVPVVGAVAVEEDPCTTPKARASAPSSSVSSFSLSDPWSPSPPSSSGMPPPAFPALHSAQRARPSPLPQRGPSSSSSSSSSLMLSSRSSRSSPSSASSLSPPPTHTAPPTKPSRAVVLAPGHSPLDWARLSSNPAADLRGLGPDGPAGLLRVTPTMLKYHSGRKGKDAWMAIGGRVYNVTPYLDFHPGGKAELLRGAAKDATKLFGEVHPWVNYETMLSACLVGIVVEEGAAVKEEGGMDEVD